LKKPGFLLITMKQGQGTVTDSDGRQFFLWQDADLRDVFQSNNLSVIDFFSQLSVRKTKDIWLGYLLKKQ